MEKITDELAEKVRAWIDGAEVKAAIEATEKAAEGDTGTFEVVITTENLDRYQEVISLDGWDLEHYRNNPVVLWGHDHFTLPIGVCTSIEVRDGKMIAKGKFAPHEHAQSIRKLYDLGIVRATSVGYIEKEREGNLITKAELLEFSFVSVPANPYALKLDTLGLEDVNMLVTKGVFNLKDIKDTTTEPEKDTEDEEETTPEERPQEEPAGDVSELTKAVKELRDTVERLVEAVEGDSGLEDTDGEPEPTEEPDAVETEEERQFREFSEKRRTLQNAATILGEVLAESRHAIEARK